MTRREKRNDQLPAIIRANTRRAETKDAMIKKNGTKEKIDINLVNTQQCCLFARAKILLQILDRDKKRSRRSRSRSRSPRRCSRSRDHGRDKNRDFKNRKNIPTLETAPPSTSGGEYILQYIFNIILYLTFVVEKDRSLSPPLVKSPEAIQLSAGTVPGFTNNPTLARIQDQLQKRRALWSNKVSVNQQLAF
jgi:hypothetical protein